MVKTGQKVQPPLATGERAEVATGFRVSPFGRCSRGARPAPRGAGGSHRPMGAGRIHCPEGTQACECDSARRCWGGRRSRGVLFVSLFASLCAPTPVPAPAGVGAGRIRILIKEDGGRPAPASSARLLSLRGGTSRSEHGAGGGSRASAGRAQREQAGREGEQSPGEPRRYNLRDRQQFRAPPPSPHWCAALKILARPRRLAVHRQPRSERVGPASWRHSHDGCRAAHRQMRRVLCCARAGRGSRHPRTPAHKPRGPEDREGGRRPGPSGQICCRSLTGRRRFPCALPAARCPCSTRLPLRLLPTQVDGGARRGVGWAACGARGGGWARECRVPSSSVMYSEMCGRAQRTAITRMHACTHARTCGRDVGTRRDTPTMQACGGGGTLERLNALRFPSVASALQSCVRRDTRPDRVAGVGVRVRGLAPQRNGFLLGGRRCCSCLPPLACARGVACARGQEVSA